MSQEGEEAQIAFSPAFFPPLSDEEYMYFLDGHVHMEHEDMFLDVVENSLTNMRLAADSKQQGQPLRGMLLFAELAGQSWGPVVQNWAVSGKQFTGRSTWQIRATSESHAVICENKQGDQVCCIIGKQVNTAENIELLLFASKTAYEKQPLIESVTHALQEDALVIVPWGVGKWLGKRGQLITSMLVDTEIEGYYLGDNGNRPWFWKVVSQFKVAREKQVPLICGSDPLFLPGEVKRVGSYGNIVPTQLNLEYPLQSLMEALEGKTVSMVAYGQLQKLYSFFMSQIRLRFAR